MMFVSSAMPTPPRRGRRPGREPQPGREPLTRDRIVDAALRLVDAGGLDAVNMRSVAEALGTGPASLYAHVSGKEELLALLIERLAGEMHLPEPDPERWQEQIKELVREMHSVLLAHRDVARASMGNIPLGEAALRVSDRMIEILSLGGLPKQVIAYAADLLPLYAVATAYEQSLFAERTSTEEGARYFEEVDAYFAALPPDRFPHMAALAPELGQGDPRERFEFGLDVLVAGLAAYGRRASTA
jgi:AcrR family transcriptional regulator